MNELNFDIEQGVIISDENEVHIMFMGEDGEEGEYQPINGLLNTTMELNNIIDTFTLYGQGGYSTSIKTGQDLTFNLEVLRSLGDPVHDELIERALFIGNQSFARIKIIGPAETVESNVVLDITTPGLLSSGGDATEKVVISGSFRATGKPVITKTGYASRLRIAPKEDNK